MSIEETRPTAVLHGNWLNFNYSNGSESWTDLRLVVYWKTIKQDTGKWTVELYGWSSSGPSKAGSIMNIDDRSDVDLIVKLMRDWMQVQQTVSKKSFSKTVNPYGGDKLL